jgi:hypothetical protein
MENETTATEIAESTEHAQDQLEAAFEEGRALSRGEFPEESQQEEAGAQSSAKLFAGLTEDELKPLLAKATEVDSLKEQLSQFQTETQKIYGKLGEYNRELQKLRSEKPTIGKMEFKRLAEDYPDLAEAMAEDMAKLSTSAPIDVQAIEANIRANVLREIEAREEVRDAQYREKAVQSEIEVLSSKHPDWKEKRHTTEYQLWFSTLPTDKQHHVHTTMSGREAAQALDEFDSWRDRGKNTKINRLERAVTPTGSSPPEKTKQSDRDAFEAGRQAARKRLGIVR